MSEFWMDIPGYEGNYMISDLGRVYSLARKDSNGVPRGGRYMIPNICKRTGYPRLTLSKDGKKKLESIHQLVMRTFVGPCPAGHEVLHGDSVRGHCALTNLRYGTRKENHEDTIKHGHTTKGEDNKGGGKLKNDDIRPIRDRLIKGDTGADIARSFGVTKEMIYSIAKGKTWSHIT